MAPTGGRGHCDTGIGGYGHRRGAAAKALPLSLGPGARAFIARNSIATLTRSPCRAGEQENLRGITAPILFGLARDVRSIDAIGG